MATTRYRVSVVLEQYEVSNDPTCDEEFSNQVLDYAVICEGDHKDAAREAFNEAR